MELVNTRQEIVDNIDVLDDYLNTPELHDYAVMLIKNGICFEMINKNGETRFYPSRFIGYRNNSQTAHESTRHKDGRETNAAVIGIIDYQPEVSVELEAEY